MAKRTEKTDYNPLGLPPETFGTVAGMVVSMRDPRPVFWAVNTFCEYRAGFASATEAKGFAGQSAREVVA